MSRHYSIVVLLVSCPQVPCEQKVAPWRKSSIIVGALTFGVIMMMLLLGKYFCSRVRGEEGRQQGHPAPDSGVRSFYDLFQTVPRLPPTPPFRQYITRRMNFYGVAHAIPVLPPAHLRGHRVSVFRAPSYSTVGEEVQLTPILRPPRPVRVISHHSNDELPQLPSPALRHPMQN